MAQSQTPDHIRATHSPDDCPVDGCETERFSRVGMEYHLLREHGY